MKLVETLRKEFFRRNNSFSKRGIIFLEDEKRFLERLRKKIRIKQCSVREMKLLRPYLDISSLNFICLMKSKDYIKGLAVRQKRYYIVSTEKGIEFLTIDYLPFGKKNKKIKVNRRTKKEALMQWVISIFSKQKKKEIRKHYIK